MGGGLEVRWERGIVGLEDLCDGMNSGTGKPI